VPTSTIASARAGEGRESLLVISDVHLGSDLNDFATTETKRSAEIDRDLVRLIDHYRVTLPRGSRWRLVIAGDFIDFIGMVITGAKRELATEPSEEETAHGLGNAEDHACEKLRRVAERHVDVFRALAAFVADGHGLTLIHGNHDIELHWQAVRDEFRAALLAHAPPGADREAFGARIEHSDWFYYQAGVAYIEHGHQYDPLCSTDHVMAPISPLDPRRLARGFCDVLLRFVVRPTRGLKEHGHERMGLVDYVSFGAKLGVRGMLSLGARFCRAVLELFRLRREHLSDAAKGLREEHERRMKLLAEAKRIGIDRLRALAALQAPPVTRSISGILASVLLDRLALALGCSIALVVIAIVSMRAGYVGFSVPLILGAWLLAHRYLSRRRRLCPDEELAERASHLARLFPAAFVVMGHTHVPMKVPVAEGSTYVNLGSWAEEESEDGESARAARTHLVIHPEEKGANAEFLQWDSASGPHRFDQAG
jgi:UDP-2,3-diacylglucosamine pyrophosphatase LpxH